MNSDHYDENELLEALGRTARAEEREDAMDADTAFQPLDEAELAGIVNGALGRIDAEAAQAKHANVVSLGAHRARRKAQILGTITTVVTLAAAALFVFWPSAHTLPSYSASVLNRESEVRSGHESPAAQGAAIALSEGSELRMVLRPEARVTGPLRVTLIARAADGRAIQLSPKVEWSDDGQALITGIVGESLPIGPGEYTLDCVISQDDARQRLELPLSVRHAQ